MNLKIIIPICVIIIALGFSFGSLIDEYIKERASSDYIKNKNTDYPAPCGACDKQSSESQLRTVLDACMNQEYGLDIYREFMNSTHHIDNNKCEWHTTEHPLYPDYVEEISEKEPIEEDKPEFFGTPMNNLDPQLQLVLDNCDAQRKGIAVTEPLLIYSNKAHYIDNVHCKWETNYQDEFETDDYTLKTINPYTKKFCTVKMIVFLTEFSNMFEEEEFYTLEWMGLPDDIGEKDFKACEHDLKAIFYPQFTGKFSKEQAMEDVTEGNFTEACNDPPNSIHANFTDGQVIPLPDNC